MIIEDTIPPWEPLFSVNELYFTTSITSSTGWATLLKTDFGDEN